MKVTIDLTVCRDQAQCAYAAPGFFSLDDAGRQNARNETAADLWTSGDVPADQVDDVVEAVAVCPTQAIFLEN